MNIHVVREKLGEHKDLTGGYACCDLHIGVDADLPLNTQMSVVVHEIVENYFPSLSHDKVEELERLIMDGLGQLSYDSTDNQGD